MQSGQTGSAIVSSARGQRVAVVLSVVLLVVVAGIGVARVRAGRARAVPFGMSMVAEPESGGARASFHGEDYSFASSDQHSLTTCDKESDSNPVRGVYRYFDPATGYGDVGIEDRDGAGGKCATIRTDRTILVHRTCERNLLAWDCNNWTDPVA